MKRSFVAIAFVTSSFFAGSADAASPTEAEAAATPTSAAIEPAQCANLMGSWSGTVNSSLSLLGGSPTQANGSGSISFTPGADPGDVTIHGSFNMADGSTMPIDATITGTQIECRDRIHVGASLSIPLVGALTVAVDGTLSATSSNMTFSVSTAPGAFISINASGTIALMKN
jgi:hypothetical protein